VAKVFSVPLADIINELSLESAFKAENLEKIYLTSRDVNRPGLELAGFLEYFDPARILLIGNTEHGFLAEFSPEDRYEAFDKLFSLKPPAVIVARDLKPYEEMLKAAREHNISILLSSESTSVILASLVSYLNVELAPRISRHGVLVEVYGEGIFLMGESGIGKSETAVELIKRGHRLVADDAVEIRKVSKKTLVGSAPENIRYFVELRGIGIVNARRLFGMGSVKMSEKIDLVIQLEKWDGTKVYDRMGEEAKFINILDINIPTITVPVKPGRNLAIIIEVAAMNNRQKKMGYNAAKELLIKLGIKSH